MSNVIARDDDFVFLYKRWQRGFLASTTFLTPK
jgi:hypothetical protein